MLEQSVADALVATDWRDLAGRRALACSCRTYGARMAAWFAKGTLNLEPHDCTEANAAFLLGPFYEKHPNTQIWTPDPEMAPDWHDEWIPGPFIAKRTLVAKRRTDALFAAQEVLDPVDTSIMNPTMAFFVGRCLAKLAERTTLRFSWTVHRPDGSEHDEQHVISSHMLKTHAWYGKVSKTEQTVAKPGKGAGTGGWVCKTVRANRQPAFLPLVEPSAKPRK